MQGTRPKPSPWATRAFTAALCAAALVGAPPPATAAIDRDTLEGLKRATVFVSTGLLRGAASGSGFLVHRHGSRGLVVTNAHVVKGADEGALRVVFDSGTRRADALDARLVGVSESRDLAVLSVESPSLPEPLRIAADAAVYETQTVHIVGFPFGKGFATNRETPVVTISRGTVSSRRLDVNDQPRLVQIDGDLNPGNSGGPIVDEEGRVVGVAVATVQQTNIGFAVPLAPLAEILAGTLTDLEGERVKDGVAIRGRVLDPLGGFRGAALTVAAMREDAVAELLDAQGRWGAIAPGDGGAAFAARADGLHEAVHALAAKLPAGSVLVAQVRVAGAGGARYLPPFRIERRALAVALAGPDVRAGDEPDAHGGDAGAAQAESQAPAEIEALFAASGLNGLIASMSEPSGNPIFREQDRGEDERTVRERLDEIIESSWEEDRIRRVYVRSFEADPNADAMRRASRIFELPAMQLMHLTIDRFSDIRREELDAMDREARADPKGFETRLELMREIDRRRGFSDLITQALSASASTLSRLVNDLKPKNTRMAPALLERDVRQSVINLQRQLQAVMPLMLAHEYREARERDLRDYLSQLDTSAMRWFAARERAAFSAVVSAQLTEAEDEILALFKEVRREALGLAESPDLEGLDDTAAMQALLDTHGKSTLIRLMLERRGGEITVRAPDGSLESRFGRPPEERISAASLLEDLRALDLDVHGFAATLEQYLVDQAYRERRLAANAERSRLIAALVARRRARLEASTNPRERRVLQREEKARRTQCGRACTVSEAECRSRAEKTAGFCRQVLPRSPREREEARRRCVSKQHADRAACRAERERCRVECG